MTAEELAALFLDQVRAHREGVPPERDEPSAIYVWEDLISDDPEEAWPVFREALRRVSDDEMLEAIWYRLRLLLYRHFENFHERAADLMKEFGRFAFVAGPRALDRSEYTKKPFEREALIHAYRAQHRTQEDAAGVERLARTDPQRALDVAIEIIHRGVARGWTAYDLMSPLRDILARNGNRVIERLEEIAKQSVAVRRVLWRLKPQMRPLSWPDEEGILQEARPDVDLDVRTRVERAAGTTTDFTEHDVAAPPPQPQLDADELIIEAWFTHEENFWGWEAVHELCDRDPLLAWSITLELIARADDEFELGAIAAGPLESLIRTHPDTIWNELWERAHADEKLVSALRGVWVFESDGDVYHRFTELMHTLEAKPN